MLYPSPDTDRAVIAYLTMEVALEAHIPTYAGGLGVLAGDTLRPAADTGVPMVGVSLLHREGYFRQHLDEGGTQHEAPAAWNPQDHLEELPQRASVEIEGRKVWLRAWRYLVRGLGARAVPVLLLDSMLNENSPEDRGLTNRLYGGDHRERLRQEAVLGLGSVAMLRALGYRDVHAYHLNEGHSALAVIAMLQEQLRGRPLTQATHEDLASVRERCVFTTHTPEPAGHDRFHLSLVSDVLGHDYAQALASIGCCPDETLNMTYLALAGSRFVNAVAMRHGDVSREMFPEYPLRSITNGVHAPTWTTEPFQALFDRHVPYWREQNSNLRYATAIPLHAIREAHDEAKRALCAEVQRRTGRELSPSVMTIGFARRAASYKRMNLLFSDVERLRAIAHRAGPLQLVLAGKAHPHDEHGKSLIRSVFQAADAVRDAVNVVYLEDYDMEIARALCGGADLWLNTPQRPHEASGTSGMKAALNGVPSLSVLDGWWIEGHAEGVTGWSIGEDAHAPTDDASDAAALYDKLEHVIVPTYYRDPEAYDRVRRSAIALNGSFFTTERMVLQYAEHAYRLT